MSATDVAEYPEAVIISGQRRGEIIRLSPANVTLPDTAVLKKLDEQLDELNEKLAILSTEIRATTAAIKVGDKN